MEKYNVLVVNQDFKSLHTIFDYLEEEGNYNVMNATNPQMVQIILRKKELDVVLLDWETSIASELEVYHYLQEQKSTRDTPIVISTHPARTQTINEIITTDIAGFVPKPIEKSTLIDAIQRAIAGQKEANEKKAEEESALEVARRKVQEEQSRIAEEKQKVESNKNAILEEQKRLQEEVEKERAQLAAVKARLDQEKAVLNTSQSDIASIREEVAASQEELQKKQEQLYTTRKQLLEDQERFLKERQELAEAKEKLFKEKEQALQEKQLLELDTEAERQALEIARQQLEVEMQLLAEDRRQLDDEHQQLHEEMEKMATVEAFKQQDLEEPVVVKQEEEQTLDQNNATTTVSASDDTNTEIVNEASKVQTTVEEKATEKSENDHQTDVDNKKESQLESQEKSQKTNQTEASSNQEDKKVQKDDTIAKSTGKREPTSEEKDAAVVLDYLKQAKEEVSPTTSLVDELAMERAQLDEMRQQLIKAKAGFEEEREKFAQEKEQILMENSKAKEGSHELASLQKSVIQAREQLSKVERELTQKQAKLKLIEMEEKASERTSSAIPAQLQKATEEADFKDIAYEGNSFSKLLEEEAARLHTSSLMQYILPEEIAKDLDKSDYEFINYYPSVSILYIGFADLMSTVLKTDRSSLINELEDFFMAINNRMQDFGLERVRTKNNMYACAQRQLSAEDPMPLLKACFEIREVALGYQGHSQEVNDLIKKMYLGVNTTDVVAGDTNRKRFAYDIWSDIIQTTYHLKQNVDVPIHLLENTYKLVEEEVKCVHVGKIRTNRRGDWKVYELISLEK